MNSSQAEIDISHRLTASAWDDEHTASIANGMFVQGFVPVPGEGFNSAFCLAKGEW